MVQHGAMSRLNDDLCHAYGGFGFLHFQQVNAFQASCPEPRSLAHVCTTYITTDYIWLYVQYVHIHIYVINK